ncbi:hypothetical protein VNO77_25893 [Canavalia gladiata]|uniref:Uncharacterized protein n=1 Tax=Canavalia gladiata TaxID=3824 RepID=A0AAN9KRD5_CANGL
MTRSLTPGSEGMEPIAVSNLEIWVKDLPLHKSWLLPILVQAEATGLILCLSGSNFRSDAVSDFGIFCESTWLQDQIKYRLEIVS